MTNPEKKVESNSNSGFIFGLSLGAAIGALTTIMINKSGEKEVIQNFESKIKEFFQDFVTDIKDKKNNVSKKIEFIDVKPEKEEPRETEKPPIVIHKKSTPKMFVKPKR